MESKKNVIGIVALVVAIIALIGVLFFRPSIPSPQEYANAVQEALGGSTSDNWSVGGNLSVTGTSALTGAITATGAATIGGDLTVTTSNTATSTINVGCVETHATSTATTIRMVFGSEAVATTTHNTGSNSNGVVVWQYGSCPI